jgi:predicted P-loop ATPase
VSGAIEQALAIARGRPDDLGAIARQESLSLDSLAEQYRQALAIEVTFSFKQLAEARAALEAVKAEYKAAKLPGSGVSDPQIKSLRATVAAAGARVDRMKRTPWTTFATFEGSRRTRESIRTCTAFVGDADKGAKLQGLLDQLDSLGCAYIVHTSTSHGCESQERYRVIIPLISPLTNPLQRYPALWESFNSKLGGVLDSGAKDPTRLSYMPRTPVGAGGHTVICVSDRPWFDASGIPTVAPTPTTSEPMETLTTLTSEQEAHVRAALTYPAMLEWLADNKNWSDLGYWLRSLSAKGRELFIWASQQAPNYDPGSPEEWWEQHERYPAQSDFRSVFKKAQSLGWDNPGTPKTAAPADFPLVASPEGPAPLVLQRTENGTALSNVNNAAEVLARQTTLAIVLDEFLSKILVKWPTDPKSRPLEDEDITRVQIELQRMGMTKMSADATYAAIKLIAKRNTVNCLADWLNDLVWDGKRRLSIFMQRGFGTAPGKYYIRAGRNMLIAMVARALTPGCQVDQAVVLEGPQGSFKSSALRIIGGEHFAELTANPNSKDFEQQMLGVWLGEFAELSAMRRVEDISRIKQFVTCRVDHYRPSYGRGAQDFPRRTVLCGSTNEECWLHDPTGGRRFIPVEVGTIDLNWLRDNRDQLFAEAMALYKAGRKWWKFPEDEAREMQEARTPEDPWLSKIRDFLRGRSEVTEISWVLDHVLSIPADRQTKAHLTRVGILLRRLGCTQQQQRRVDGVRRRPWTVPAEFATQPCTHFGPVAFQAVGGDVSSPNADLV